MNYRAHVAEIRSARDRELAVLFAAHWQRVREIERGAGRKIAVAKDARDEEIHRLASEGKSGNAIAAAVGCSRALVSELLNPGYRAAYNRRRREHWRLITRGKAA